MPQLIRNIFLKGDIKSFMVGRFCGSESQHLVIKSFIGSHFVKMLASLRPGRVPAEESITKVFNNYLAFLPFTTCCI